MKAISFGWTTLPAHQLFWVVRFKPVEWFVDPAAELAARMEGCVVTAVEPLGCVHCGAVREVHVLPTLGCPDPRLWTVWQAPTFTRHCEVNLTGMHVYRREGEDPSRAYCACGDSRLRDGVPIDLQSERERRRG